MRKIKSSKYFGVCKYKRKSGTKEEMRKSEEHPYQAQIVINGKQVKLGNFKTEREAAIAVDMKIISENLNKKLNVLKQQKNDSK